MYESAPWVRDRGATRLLISMVSSQQQLWTFGKSRRSGSEQALFKNEAWSAPEIERERSQRKVSQIPVSLRLVISFSSCCKKKKSFSRGSDDREFAPREISALYKSRGCVASRFPQ
jgi:hypothetical protein